MIWQPRTLVRAYLVFCYLAPREGFIWEEFAPTNVGGYGFYGNEVAWAAFRESTVQGAGWTMMQ